MIKNMTIKQLIADITPVTIVGDANREVTDVIDDSRKASAGCLFVAIKGVAVDSHRFIDNTIAAGATAIVCEDLPEHLAENVTYVQVEDGRYALSHIAGAWYDTPRKNCAWWESPAPMAKPRQPRCFTKWLR